MAEKYVAVVGFDHDKTETRVEAGEVVPKLPAPVIRNLLAQGAIAEAAAPAAGAASGGLATTRTSITNATIKKATSTDESGGA